MSRLEFREEDGRKIVYDNIGDRHVVYKEGEKAEAIRQLAEAAYYQAYPKGFANLAMEIATCGLTKRVKTLLRGRQKILSQFGLKMNPNGTIAK